MPTTIRPLNVCRAIVDRRLPVLPAIRLICRSNSRYACLALKALVEKGYISPLSGINSIRDYLSLTTNANDPYDHAALLAYYIYEPNKATINVSMVLDIIQRAISKHLGYPCNAIYRLWQKSIISGQEAYQIINANKGWHLVDNNPMREKLEVFLRLWGDDCESIDLPTLYQKKLRRVDNDS